MDPLPFARVAVDKLHLVGVNCVLRRTGRPLLTPVQCLLIESTGRFPAVAPFP